MRWILAVSALALGATAAASTSGNGHLTTQVRSARGFTKVELQIPLNATVREAGDFQVKVTVDENLQPAIVTEVRGDTLVVRCQGSLDASGDARVEVSLPELKGVAAAGSGDVSVTASRRKDLSLALSGSGDLSYQGPAARLRVGDTGSGELEVKLTGDADDVEVGSKGSGDITIRGGRARELTAAVAGSGSVKAEHLTAHSGRLASSGSGDIEATLDGGSASFAVAGSGDITWHGSASVANQVRSGSGEVVHR